MDVSGKCIARIRDLGDLDSDPEVKEELLIRIDGCGI